MEISEIYLGLETIKRSLKALHDILPNNDTVRRDYLVCGAAQMKLADYAIDSSKKKRSVTNEQLDSLAKAAWGNHSFLVWEDVGEPIKIFYTGIAKRVLEALGVSVEMEKS